MKVNSQLKSIKVKYKIFVCMFLPKKLVIAPCFILNNETSSLNEINLKYVYCSPENLPKCSHCLELSGASCNQTPRQLWIPLKLQTVSQKF